MTDDDATDATDGTAPEPALVRRLRHLARWRSPSGPWQRVVQVVAALVFVVGAVVSARALDLGPGGIRWWPVVVLAVAGTPLTIALNAAELRVMAWCLDGRDVLTWSRSVRVVVVATAANVLPLPGGALVRIQALRATGASGGRATAINLVAALMWVATAVGVGGLAAWSRVPLVAGLAVVGAMVGGIASLVALRMSAPGWSPAAAATLFALELATTLLHGAKLTLALWALDVTAGIDQALVLGVAGPVSAAAGVFPSGLGLAEVLAALTATLVALAPAAGFGATALVRIVGLASTAPLVLGLRDVRSDLSAENP